MHIKSKQLSSREQIAILRALAKSVARHGCKFLEIGSWCGDSSVVLAEVAKENKGNLFCIDWWKGNIGTELAEIASKHDVFSYFWRHINDRELQETVVPIRAKSDLISNILKKEVFDLIFVDGDHRYQAILKDLKQYAPLVRCKGVFCGDDCEGRITDFDMDFLESGKETDYHENVHCGVVLAVGTFFKEYSIDYNIWSARLDDKNGWEPTQIVVPGLFHKRQTAPSPMLFTRNYRILCYEKLLYAVPSPMNNFDITEENVRNHPQVISEATLDQLKKRIGDEMMYSELPVLIDCHKDYNIVQYKDRLYGVPQSLGPIDLVDAKGIKKVFKNQKCFTGTYVEEVKRMIDKRFSMVDAQLTKEGYRGFNIVVYRKKYYALRQDIGSVNLLTIDVENLVREGKCIVANSINEVERLINQMTAQPIEGKL